VSPVTDAAHNPTSSREPNPSEIDTSALGEVSHIARSLSDEVHHLSPGRWLLCREGILIRHRDGIVGADHLPSAIDCDEHGTESRLSRQAARQCEPDESGTPSDITHRVRLYVRDRGVERPGSRGSLVLEQVERVSAFEPFLNIRTDYPKLVTAQHMTLDPVGITGCERRKVAGDECTDFGRTIHPYSLADRGSRII
jgi:hypothetical protein